MFTKSSLPEFPEASTSSPLDVAGKFRIYRMNAECTERKLKEAKMIIDELKEQLTLSRDSEQNLRNQLSLTQNRLIYLQQILKNFMNYCGQQRQNDKISQQIEKKVDEISEAIKRIRDESQNFFQHVSKEMELQKEIKDIKSALKIKNSELDLMKMENTSLATAKKNMETANQQKLKNLETELEKLKQMEIDREIRYNETLLYYQHELEENKRKLQAYERERHNFLDDFELSKDTEKNSNDFTLAESTVSIMTSDRLPNILSDEGKECEIESGKTRPQVFQCLPSVGKSKLSSLKKKNNQFSTGMSKKQKPQLEFLTQSQNSFQTPDCVTKERKRRLFSTNCNQYIE